jgi:hypothetical protein
LTRSCTIIVLGALCALALLATRVRAQEASPDKHTTADSQPGPHYNDGFVLVPTVDPVAQPFRLKI